MNAQPIDSAVLEGLYGAALHDDDWTAALERSLVLLRSADVSLSIADLGEFTFCASTGRLIGPDAQRSYLDHFHALDPKRPIFAAAGPGFLFNDTQHFDARFVETNTFYQEFSAPIASRYTLDLLLGGEATCDIYFAAVRTARQGPFEASEERLIRALGPHFARAAMLRRKLQTARRAAATAGGVLEALNFGVAVLDETGRTAIVNAAAKRALTGRELGLRQGRLTASLPDVDRKLQASLRRARDEPGAPPSVLRAVRADGGEWILWVMRLPATSAFALDEAPGVLVLIGDPRRPGGLTREAVANLFALTEAEADLALALAHGHTLAAFAAERRVKPSTARTQLLAVLQKTGVHRQVDLIRLLTTLPGAHIEGL